MESVAMTANRTLANTNLVTVTLGHAIFCRSLIRRPTDVIQT